MALRLVSKALDRSFPRLHYVSAPIIAHNHVTGEMHRREPRPELMKKAKRPMQGLDMNKLYFPQWWYPGDRTVQRDGYGNWGHLPQFHTLTIEEQHAFFECHEWWKTYTPWQYTYLCLKSLVFHTWCTVMMLMCFVPTISYSYYSSYYEPLERFMDRDEYFADYWWNTYGMMYDHHAYEEWLERRRSKKYRGVEFEDHYHGKPPLPKGHTYDPGCYEKL